MPFVIIGLGNPGDEYRTHRHNIGFHVVDYIAEKCGCAFKKPHFYSNYFLAECTYSRTTFFLVKPQTFMNCSGEVIKNVLKKTNTTLEDLIIVFDNLDLEIGQIKLKQRGSSGGHNGLESIFHSVKTDKIIRIGIGIGRPQYKADVIRYVLGTPAEDEAPLLTAAVQRTSNEILNLSRQTVTQMMTQINRRNKNDDSR